MEDESRYHRGQKQTGRYTDIYTQSFPKMQLYPPPFTKSQVKASCVVALYCIGIEHKY